MVEEKHSPEDAPKGAGSYRPNLPHHERLSNWEKRTQIINQGKSVKYDNLFISILPQSYWELSVVTKRGSGKASQRNEFKRKIKESFRLCKPRCRFPAAVAVTVLHKPDCLKVETLEKFLVSNINTLLK